MANKTLSSLNIEEFKKKYSIFTFRSAATLMDMTALKLIKMKLQSNIFSIIV